MHITPISNRNLYSPQFRSINRYVTTPKGKTYQTFTLFYRSDLNWKEFVNFLDNKYRNIPNVNIFNFACSEGAEPYSLAMTLIENLKEKSTKFLPIKASDIDSKNMEIIRKGQYLVNKGELNKIIKNTKNNFNTYFNHKDSISSDSAQLIVTPLLKEKVKYKQSDILTEIKDAPKSNSVFLIRNVWPYLDFDERAEILIELSKLDKSCCVVIGEIDPMTNIGQNLELYGFKKTPLTNVYEKEF